VGSTTISSPRHIQQQTTSLLREPFHPALLSAPAMYQRQQVCSALAILAAWYAINPPCSPIVQLSLAEYNALCTPPIFDNIVIAAPLRIAAKEQSMSHLFNAKARLATHYLTSTE
jgi:hypothetical protein